MRTFERAGLPRLPVIGQGTWFMGERRAQRSAEVDALRLGISLGMTLINSAELYGAGGAEEVVGDAITDCRDDVFVVTKVWPSHARAQDVELAVRESCRRMRTPYVDLVLLHWPTRSVPLKETVNGLRAIQRAGLARHVGVSNFDVAWLERLRRCEEHPGEMLANEVPYSLSERGVERGVLQEAQEHGRLVLAYSPLAHGRYSGWEGKPGLLAAARTHSATPLQIALAWTVQRGGIVAIPKALSPAHIRANAAAGDIVISPEEMAAIGLDFPEATKPFRPALPANMAMHRLAFGAMQLQKRLRG
ncbi:MAG: aldo/keto reductase [Thermaerobacter sp.]|nr:aldo/keto reductase [Thermaerobacter sp.]